jgi:hypothetical protein
MAAPVVVSRIQNRRGTQAQFYALYPAGYNGVGGFGGYSVPAVTISSTSGTGTIATLTVSALPAGIFIGSQIMVAGAGIPAYDGTYAVTSFGVNTISYASTATGNGGPHGTVTFPYNLINYSEVLAPGELALCTDTRNIFMGNINGEYLEIGQASSSNINPTPLTITLVPASTFTLIPSLTYVGNPFITLWYDLTDTVGANWNNVGTNFSRNGQLQISCITFGTAANLTDISTEINNYVGGTVNFEAQFDGTHVTIYYINTLASNTVTLTFSTTSIQWAPF